MFRFLKVLFNNICSGPVTEKFPFGPPVVPAKLSGKIVVDPKQCVLCGVCRYVCAGNAINYVPSRLEDATEETGDKTQFMVWHNTCCRCGLCVHYCPTKAISFSTDFLLAHNQTEKYKMTEVQHVQHSKCTECAVPLRPRTESLNRRLNAEDKPLYSELVALCPACKRKRLILKRVSHE